MLPYIGNEEMFQINTIAVSFGKLEEFNTPMMMTGIECMDITFWQMNLQMR